MINTTISHYRIVKLLGEGGMGQVYLAEDTNLDRFVAMKVLTTKYNADPDFLARFKREARAAAKLDHPNIVRIYESDVHNGITYIVMEYVDDGSLRDLIVHNKLPIPKVLEIVIQISVGLGVAHARGMVHRDIKPDNIFLSKTGQVKIGDFGIAKLQDTTGLTQAGGAIGTPYYMAPEQFKNQKVDTRADIFSLGVLLWEMLAQQRPFTGDTGYAIMFAITQTEPSPLTKFNPNISRNLQKIVDRCLQKDVNKRYQEVEELQRDLRAEEQNQRRSSDRTETVFITHRPDLKKVFPKPWRRAAMLAFAALALVAFIYLLGNSLSNKPASQVATADLSITTNPPGAPVFLNGDSLGVTPLKAPIVQEGAITLRFRKRGFVTLDTAIVVQKGVAQNFFAALLPVSRVAIVVDPRDAEVEMDGVVISAPDLAKLELAPGPHTIRISRSGYNTKEEEFRLQPGDNPARRYALEKIGPGVGGVEIAAQPPGVEITFNGARVGNTRYQAQNLTPRRYSLSLSLDGYKTYSGNVIVRAGQTTSFEMTLEPATVVALVGKLSIKSEPEGASIELNGNAMIGVVTPYENNSTPVGQYEIVLRKKGYKDYTSAIVVEAQQRRTVEARLEALRGKLQILVLPFGTIYLDGSVLIRDSNVRFMKDLPVGAYELNVTHPKFGNYKKTVNIRDDATTEVTVDFNRQLDIGVASFDETGAKPLWGEIYVDGEGLGQTPRLLKLRLGQHRIEVRRDGYIALDEAMVINLEENWKQPLRFRLKKKE